MAQQYVVTCLAHSWSAPVQIRDGWNMKKPERTWPIKAWLIHMFACAWIGVTSTPYASRLVAADWETLKKWIEPHFEKCFKHYFAIEFQFLQSCMIWNQVSIMYIPWTPVPHAPLSTQKSVEVTKQSKCTKSWMWRLTADCHKHMWNHFALPTSV